MARMNMAQFEKKLKRWMQKFPDLVIDAVESVAQKNVIPYIQSEYLSGPRPTRLGVVSGTLRRRIAHKTDRSKRMVQIGTNVTSKGGFSYPRYWERGAKRPRPFLAPGVHDQRLRVAQAIVDAVTRGYDGK
jgi:hypothetical protein